MINTIKTNIRLFWDDTSGATAIEYGLLAALIAVTMISAADCVGRSVNANLRCVSFAMEYEGYLRTDEGMSVCVDVLTAIGTDF